jgi:hypothetical protein
MTVLQENRYVPAAGHVAWTFALSFTPNVSADLVRGSLGVAEAYNIKSHVQPDKNLRQGILNLAINERTHSPKRPNNS